MNKNVIINNLVFVLLFISISTLYAQPNTNIYLYDIVEKEGKISFENIRTIANNTGYNNQPSFYDDNTLLFVSTRNGQTDIVQYTIDQGDYKWLTDTPGGSEYSPLRIPNSTHISAIRLDTTGFQRLYKYNYDTGKSNLLLDRLKVGYHVWDNKDQLITAVLVKDEMNLMLSYLPEKKSNTVDMGVGRSLHKIPESNLISFISAQKGAGLISSYNPVSGEIKGLINMPFNAQDMCWLNKDTVLIPNGKSILSASVKSKNKELTTVQTFKEKEIYKISRMIVSPDGKYLAVVSDESPELLVDRQVDTFNLGDLEGFVGCFSDSVSVNIFPDQKLYSGKNKMRTNYGQHMAKQLKTQVAVVKRIKINNVIIDEEIVKEGSEAYHQAAIYEIDRGQIAAMTFIHEAKPPSPVIEETVQKQLNAYNSRNLAAFMSHYADDAVIYNFPNRVSLTGKNEIRASYANFFERASDLHANIKSRIVVGNKVIDDEIVHIGSSNFRAVAVYEIENGLIKKVTFIR